MFLRISNRAQRLQNRCYRLFSTVPCLAAFEGSSPLAHRVPLVQIPCLHIGTGSNRAKLSHLSARTCKLMLMTRRKKVSTSWQTKGQPWWGSIYDPRINSKNGAMESSLITVLLRVGTI